MAGSRMQATKTYTESDFKDFAHTGPGTLAGNYLRSFWQPVYRLEDIAPGWTKPIRIMGEDLTLYRGEGGAPHLVAFRCAHRSSQLSTGWVEEDCIRCFYHGWKYDGLGQCVEQPAEPRPFAEKVKITGYPAQEYLGYIFAYLGEGAPPPFPRYSNFEETDGVHYVEVNHRACNYFQNIENGLDIVHAGFVHRSLEGTFDGVSDSPSIQIEETEWGFNCHTEHPSGRRETLAFGMPNINRVISFPDDPVVAYREFISWKVPVDDENHIQFLMASIGVPPDMARLYEERRSERLIKQETFSHLELAQKVLAGELRMQDVDPETTEIILVQDGVAQGSQGVIVDREVELLGHSDAPVIATRKLWSEELRALAEGRPLRQWTYDPSPLPNWQLSAT